ncbi:hypothetical protein MRX96_001212 [Rhipicephalus microplus]
MADNDLLDYEEDEEQEQAAEESIQQVKKPTGGYVSIHSSGFRDLLLRPRASARHPWTVASNTRPRYAKEYERSCKYLPAVRVAVFFGGMNISNDEKGLADSGPHIVAGTPGRVLALVRTRKLQLRNVKHFVLDECDKILEQLDMRRDVQEIFRATPHEKQVIMFSATLSKDVRPVCLKFMQDPMDVYVDDEANLTLHGLQQYYVKLRENKKNRKLI